MKVYVGNLSKEVTDSQLNDLFVPYGKPTSATVVKERNTGESKGFAFVEFGTDDEAKAAITALNGKDYNGQALKVNEAKSKEKPAQAAPAQS